MPLHLMSVTHTAIYLYNSWMPTRTPGAVLVGDVIYLDVPCQSVDHGFALHHYAV